MKPLRKALLVFGFLSLAFLAGCGREPLYQDLTEQDANEILVVLYRNGIDAVKQKVEAAQEVSYTVAVSRNDIQKARRILVESNLPRRRALGFSEICKEKGLIPTPEEEKCRKLLALKGEIINSLEKVPGVIEADVVLNIPEISEFSTETQTSKRPTASAIVKTRRDAAYEITESRLQRFISNTVENLDPRDVSVIINFIEPPQEILNAGPVVPGGVGPVGMKLATLAGLTFEEGSVNRFKIYAAVMLVLLIGVSAALIVHVIKLTKLRQELRVSKVQGGGAELPAGASPPLLEGGVQTAETAFKPGERAANQPQ
jgi:type III secretion protein J